MDDDEQVLHLNIFQKKFPVITQTKEIRICCCERVNCQSSLSFKMLRSTYTIWQTLNECPVQCTLKRSTNHLAITHLSKLNFSFDFAAIFHKNLNKKMSKGWEILFWACSISCKATWKVHSFWLLVTGIINHKGRKMKILQVVQKTLAIVGICQNPTRASSRKIKLILSLFVLAIIFSTIYICHDANTFLEYSYSMYLTTVIALVIFDYVIVIFNMSKLFDLIFECQEIFEQSKSTNLKAKCLFESK